jgi:hypothetical protein
MCLTRGQRASLKKLAEDAVEECGLAKQAVAAALGERGLIAYAGHGIETVRVQASEHTVFGDVLPVRVCSATAEWQSVKTAD